MKILNIFYYKNYNKYKLVFLNIKNYLYKTLKKCSRLENKIIVLLIKLIIVNIYYDKTQILYRWC